MNISGFVRMRTLCSFGQKYGKMVKRTNKKAGIAIFEKQNKPKKRYRQILLS